MVAPVADSEGVFLSLSLDTGTRNFSSIEEVATWLAAERAFFAWEQAGHQSDSGCQPAWNASQHLFNVVQQFIDQYKRHKSSEPQLANVFNTLRSEIDAHKKKGRLLTSQNPDAIFAKDLATSEDPAVACYAVCALLNIDTNQSNQRALKGTYLALQYRQGSSLNVKAQAEALAALREQWNQNFNEREEQTKMGIRGLTEQFDALNLQSSGLLEEIRKGQMEQGEQFDVLVQSSKATLEDIAKTYDNKLALQSSVSYWRMKRRHHTTVMTIVGICTLLLAGATGGGFIWAATSLLKVKFQEVELSHLGVMLAISTFGIWATRLSAKIFISNLHLRTDADERVTMVQTYLALLREGAGPKDNERQLILQTLFRPSNSGFINDEGPTAFYELIQKAFSRAP